MSPIGPEELERLLARHAGPLFLYARQWSAAPEDAVQDALLQLVRQKTAPENVIGWLYRAVRNRAISDARSDRRRQHRERSVSHNGEPWFKPGTATSLDAASATRALRTLPIEQRETVVARLWGGLSFGEIAKLTETSSSTAARRYQAALATLRERLRVKCSAPEQTKTK
jgi:RNA polymerase sigma-70 factor (ECF subfamily)